MTGTQVKKVAIVVADGFEQVELEVPSKALREAGYSVDIVSPVAGSSVRGYNHAEKGDDFPIDVHLTTARAENYGALLLPGGVSNPDQLRQDPKVLDFVRQFFAAGKPVAAICHGPWTLIDAGVAGGRKLTSWPSLRADLSNAGAEWVDEPVVADRGLVTSRGPQDLQQFCKKMLEVFSQGPCKNPTEAAMLTKLADLVKDIKVAMLTTHAADGTLHSRPMVAQGKRFDQTLWFFTRTDSGCNREITEDAEVNVSYTDPGAGRYVSVNGRAKLVRDRKKAAELWNPLARLWFPKGLDDPELCLLRVTAERAEYWEAPAFSASFLLSLARSLLTGRPYLGDGTQHKKIDFGPLRTPTDETAPTPNPDDTEARAQAGTEPEPEPEPEPAFKPIHEPKEAVKQTHAKRRHAPRHV